MPPNLPAPPSGWLRAHRTKTAAKSSRDFAALHNYIVLNWKKMGRPQLYKLAVEAAECLTPAGSPICKVVAQGIMMSLDAKHDGKNTKDPWPKRTPTKPRSAAPSARQQATPPPEKATSPTPASDLDTDIQNSPHQPTKQLLTPDPTPAKATTRNPDRATGNKVVQYIRRTRSELNEKTEAIRKFIEEQEAELYNTPAQDAEERNEVEGSVRELRSLRQQMVEIQPEDEA